MSQGGGTAIHSLQHHRLLIGAGGDPRPATRTALSHESERYLVMASNMLASELNLMAGKAKMRTEAVGLGQLTALEVTGAHTPLNPL